ncbi:MAG TPA: transcription-repair coupling factor, partial [Tissierellia bacterium]|nr:transcription-repair coupling factor [Tissierellia bacterium]
QLEDTMLAFRAGESDVLLSTTLIETGMDIANVNTILIENAQNLGLSQLYQLRGRVGRSNRIAYAYLFFPRDKILTEEAVARLETIREFTDFGSGFKVALRDMEIRGSGHLLGSSQSGHFADIGYELYMQMLMETAKKLKGEPIKQVVQTQIDLGISAYLPEAYISHSGVRMEIYRRIRDIDSREAMEAMEEELLDRFGDLPKEAMNLLETALIGSLASTVPFKEIRRYGDEIRCYFVEEMMPPIEWITQVDKTLSPIVRMHLHKNPRLIISPENPGDTQVLLDIFERLVLFKEEPEGYNEP